MSYTARDLLTDVVDDANVWAELSAPAKLIAVVRPLVDVARILGDQDMLQHFRLLAVLHGVEQAVPAQEVLDQRALARPLPLRQVVPLLRDAGSTRDAARLAELGLGPSELEALARCAHLLGSAALALGKPRSCRIYVMAARVVDGVAAAT